MRGSSGCVPTITFELDDLRPRHLACRFIMTLFGSSSKVKVTVHRQQQMNKVFVFAGMDARYDVSYFWLLVGATSSNGFLVVMFLVGY